MLRMRTLLAVGEICSEDGDCVRGEVEVVLEFVE